VLAFTLDLVDFRGKMADVVLQFVIAVLQVFVFELEILVFTFVFGQFG